MFAIRQRQIDQEMHREHYSSIDILHEVVSRLAANGRHSLQEAPSIEQLKIEPWSVEELMKASQQHFLNQVKLNFWSSPETSRLLPLVFGYLSTSTPFQFHEIMKPDYQSHINPTTVKPILVNHLYYPKYYPTKEFTLKPSCTSNEFQQMFKHTELNTKPTNIYNIHEILSNFDPKRANIYLTNYNRNEWEQFVLKIIEDISTFYSYPLHEYMPTEIIQEVLYKHFFNKLQNQKRNIEKCKCPSTLLIVVSDIIPDLMNSQSTTQPSKFHVIIFLGTNEEHEISTPFHSILLPLQYLLNTSNLETTFLENLINLSKSIRYKATLPAKEVTSRPQNTNMFQKNKAQIENVYKQTLLQNDSLINITNLQYLLSVMNSNNKKTMSALPINVQPFKQFRSNIGQHQNFSKHINQKNQRVSQNHPNINTTILSILIKKLKPSRLLKNITSMPTILNDTYFRISSLNEVTQMNNSNINFTFTETVKFLTNCQINVSSVLVHNDTNINNTYVQQSLTGNLEESYSVQKSSIDLQVKPKSNNKFPNSNSEDDTEKVFQQIIFYSNKTVLPLVTDTLNSSIIYKLLPVKSVPELNLSNSIVKKSHPNLNNTKSVLPSSINQSGIKPISDIHYFTKFNDNPLSYQVDHIKPKFPTIFNLTFFEKHPIFNITNLLYLQHLINSTKFLNNSKVASMQVFLNSPNTAGNISELVSLITQSLISNLKNLSTLTNLTHDATIKHIKIGDILNTQGNTTSMMETDKITIFLRWNLSNPITSQNHSIATFKPKLIDPTYRKPLIEDSNNRNKYQDAVLQIDPYINKTHTEYSKIPRNSTGTMNQNSQGTQPEVNQPPDFNPIFIQYLSLTNLTNTSKLTNLFSTFNNWRPHNTDTLKLNISNTTNIQNAFKNTYFKNVLASTNLTKVQKPYSAGQNVTLDEIHSKSETLLTLTTLLEMYLVYLQRLKTVDEFKSLNFTFLGLDNEQFYHHQLKNPGTTFENPLLNLIYWNILQNLKFTDKEQNSTYIGQKTHPKPLEESVIPTFNKWIFSYPLQNNLQINSTIMQFIQQLNSTGGLKHITFNDLENGYINQIPSNTILLNNSNPENLKSDKLFNYIYWQYLQSFNATTNSTNPPLSSSLQNKQTNSKPFDIGNFPAFNLSNITFRQLNPKLNEHFTHYLLSLNSTNDKNKQVEKLLRFIKWVESVNTSDSKLPQNIPEFNSTKLNAIDLINVIFDYMWLTMNISDQSHRSFSKPNEIYLDYLAFNHSNLSGNYSPTKIGLLSTLINSQEQPENHINISDPLVFQNHLHSNINYWQYLLSTLSSTDSFQNSKPEDNSKPANIQAILREGHKTNPNFWQWYLNVSNPLFNQKHTNMNATFLQYVLNYINSNQQLNNSYYNETLISKMPSTFQLEPNNISFSNHNEFWSKIKNITHIIEKPLKETQFRKTPEKTRSSLTNILPSTKRNPLSVSSNIPNLSPLNILKRLPFL